MAAHTLPGIGLTGGRSAGESGWAAEMNTNLQVLSALTQLSVLSRTTALPGSPSDGMIYIAPAPDNRVAVRDAGSWVYLSPIEGWRAWVQDEDTEYTWSGSAWIQTQPFDVAAFIAGTPTASETVLRYVFTRSARFADEFAGSRGNAGIPATAATTFTVTKNGSAVGTLTFDDGATAATFTTTGAGVVSFAAGDVLAITAPASPDATLADVAITLAGTR